MAISQMEQVTQKTAANAEECAAAAEELNALSETLKDVLERLTAMVGRGDSAAASDAVPRRKRVSSAHGAAPTQDHGESSAGLSALRSAVSHKPAKAYIAEPVLAGARAGKSAFPLEEEFKEF